MTTKEICEAEKDVLHIMAHSIQSKGFSRTDCVNLADCSNIYLLQNQDETELPENLHFVKQRSSRWHEIRRNFRITGQCNFFKWQCN